MDLNGKLFLNKYTYIFKFNYLILKNLMYIN